METNIRQLLKRTGYLSGLVIDEEAGCPSSSAYSARFGNLLRAYELVGYTPERDYQYLAINRRLRAMHPDIIQDTVARLRALGASVSFEGTGLLYLNGEFSISLVIARCKSTLGGALRWHIRLDQGISPDVTVAIRMNPDNQTVRDYFILPTHEVNGKAFRTAEANGVMLDAFLFSSLDPLFDLAERVPIKEIA